MRLWIAYLTAAILTDLIKIARFMREQPPDKHKSFLGALGDFFIGDRNTAVTSVTTVSVVWVLGAVYIDKLALEAVPFVGTLPQHPAIAALLGSLAELIAPPAVKWILGKVFPA